jgi:hypothetical protein
VAAVPDQHPVQTLGPRGADPPFRIGVRDRHALES